MKKLTLLFFALTSLNVYGQWLWSPNPSINDSICVLSTNASHASVCVDGNGGAFISWDDRRNGGPPQVYVQRKDALGNEIFAANGISVASSPNMYGPIGIVPDGRKGAIVFWREVTSGTNWTFKAQRLSPAGNLLWGANGVMIHNGTNLSTPSISADSANGAYITWRAVNNNTTDLYASRIDSSGVLVWSNVNLVAVPRLNPVTMPVECTTGENGNLFVAWTDYRASAWGDIYGRWITESGIPIGQNNGTPICTNSADQSVPRIAKGTDGAVVVAWNDQRDTVHTMFAQKIDSNGNSMWQFNGERACFGWNNGFEVSADTLGNCFLTGIMQGEVMSQKINLNGLPQWGISGQPITYQLTPVGSAQIKCDGNSIYIMWNDLRSGNLDIYAQKLTNLGIAEWDSGGIVVTNSIVNHQSYDWVLSGCGIICSWHERRSGSYDVFAAKVCNGGLLASQIIQMDGIVTANDTICLGDSVLLTGTTQLGVNYQWFINGFAINGADSSSFHSGQAGTYHLQVTSSTDTTFSNSVIIIVDSGAAITISGLIPTSCSNDSAFMLNGTPNGGTFVGNGMIGNNFDPAASGIGNHTILYNYVNVNGCFSQDSVHTTVLSDPGPVAFCCLDSQYCETDPAISLSGNPGGGLFSGAGVSGNAFSPSSGGLGLHTVTYSITNGNGCTSSHQASTQVYPLPQADFNYQSIGADSFNFFDLSTGTVTEWYWDFGDGITHTAQNPSHSYSTPGNYLVCLIVKNEVCQDSICSLIGITSADPFRSPLGLVYPNPATNVINLPANDKVIIQDYLGKVVATLSNIRTLSVTDIPRGFYFLVLYNESAKRIFKIILE